MSGGPVVCSDAGNMNPCQENKISASGSVTCNCWSVGNRLSF